MRRAVLWSFAALGFAVCMLDAIGKHTDLAEFRMYFGSDFATFCKENP